MKKSWKGNAFTGVFFMVVAVINARNYLINGCVNLRGAILCGENARLPVYVGDSMLFLLGCFFIYVSLTTFIRQKRQGSQE